MTTLNTQEFTSFQQLFDYLEEDLNISLDTIEDMKEQLPNHLASDISLFIQEDKMIIGAYSYDEMPMEFGSDGYEGEFHQCSSKEHLDSLVKKAKTEKKLIYLVDRYKHSGVDYFIHGTAHYSQGNSFDVSSFFAVYIPPSDIQEDYKKMRRKEGELEAFKHFVTVSNNMLKTYSDYANGEIFLNHIWVFNQDGNLIENDTVSGSIGYHAADSFQEELMKDTIDRLFPQQSLLKNKM